MRFAFILLILLASCGGGDDSTPPPDAPSSAADAAPADSAAPDATPNPVSTYDFGGGPVAATAVRTRNPDGSEGVHGETRWDFGASLGVKMEVIEDLALDAGGFLVSADAHYVCTIGTTVQAKRILIDAQAGTVRVTRAGWVVEFTVPTDAPLVFAHFSSDSYFNARVETPATLYAFARAAQGAATLRAFDYDYHGTWTFAAADAVIAQTGDNIEYDFFGSPFIVTPGFVLSWTMVFFDAPVSTLADSWGDLLDVTVDDGTTAPLVPAGCTITTGTSENVTITSADGTVLSGVVHVPAGTGPFPYVVAVPNWNGCNRECVRSEVPHAQCWAKDLVEAGVGVFLVDDRGYVAGSTPHARHQTYLEDTIAKAEYVAGRADAAPGLLFLLAFRTGAYTAGLVASAVPQVSGIAVVNGYGTATSDVVIEGGAAAATDYGGTAALIAIVRANRETFVMNVLSGPDSYMKDMFLADARVTLGAANLPTLIVQSDSSWFAPPAHAELLGDALTTGGNTTVTVTHVPTAGYEFQVRPPGLPPGAEVYLPTAPDPAATAAVTSWIAAQ